jgi:bacterioferritin-associated ferredoxin
MSEIVYRTKPRTPFSPLPTDSTVICRCEEVTQREIRLAVYDGMRTMNEVKRLLRCGMGLCQGQTCHRMVRNLIAGELQVSPSEVDPPAPRPPVRPIPMRVLAVDGLAPADPGEKS